MKISYNQVCAWPGFRSLRFYISFRSQHKIEFRDCADVSIVLCTYSTLSLPPGPLFRSTTSSSTLLFADLSTELIGVHRLDCSGSKPRLVGRKIDIPLKWKYNMCYASGDGKSLLGVAYPHAVYVYNTQQSRVEWTTDVINCSIDTDGHHYLLICDPYKIRLFSLSDGKDLGSFIKRGDQGLGELDLVRWCNTTSSLIVAHRVGGLIYISKIEFEPIFIAGLT